MGAVASIRPLQSDMSLAHNLLNACVNSEIGKSSNDVFKLLFP